VFLTVPPPPRRYNFNRWFPSGKVIFCAPTRPLVTQQIEACYLIMGIPISSTAEITGQTKVSKRGELWKNHSVFFCTPQTLDKDVNDNKNFDASKVVCLVLDEAHRAKGDYAYVKAVRGIAAAGARFRTVGLSATPGADRASIDEVLRNLRVEKLEAKTDDDEDVKKYVERLLVERLLVLFSPLEFSVPLHLPLPLPFLFSVSSSLLLLLFFSSSSLSLSSSPPTFFFPSFTTLPGTFTTRISRLWLSTLRPPWRP